MEVFMKKIKNFKSGIALFLSVIVISVSILPSISSFKIYANAKIDGIEAWGDGWHYYCIDGHGYASNGVCTNGDIYKLMPTENLLNSSERAIIFWATLSFTALYTNNPKATRIVTSINQNATANGLKKIGKSVTEEDLKAVLYSPTVRAKYDWLDYAIANADKYLQIAGLLGTGGSTGSGKPIPTVLQGSTTMSSAKKISPINGEFILEFDPSGADADFLAKVPIKMSGDSGITWSTGSVNGWTYQKNNTQIKFSNPNPNAAPVLIQFDPAGTEYCTTTSTYASADECYINTIEAVQCVQCSGKHIAGPKTHPLEAHQRNVWLTFIDQPAIFYASINGDPSPIPGDGGINFKVYRHEEDMSSNYNIQLYKYDFETGKPLEGSTFKLYERFDDNNEIDTGSDGPVAIYEGGAPYSSEITNSPAIWSGFRFVTSKQTDQNGHLTYTSQKGYHYDKTFCDGHASPEFVEVPEPEYLEIPAVPGVSEASKEQINEAEIEEAKAKNMELAQAWLDCFNSCGEKSNGDFNGVHFHWLLDDVDQGEIISTADSGGEEGSTPDGGNTAGADGDTSYERSGCKEDCENTYAKFISLKYSYVFTESTARTGYTLHGNHSEDIPIEVITTDSSENGANSEFSNCYGNQIDLFRMNLSDQSEETLKRTADKAEIEVDSDQMNFYTEDKLEGSISAITGNVIPYILEEECFPEGDEELEWEEWQEEISQSEVFLPKVTPLNATPSEAGQHQRADNVKPTLIATNANAQPAIDTAFQIADFQFTPSRYSSPIADIFFHEAIAADRSSSLFEEAYDQALNDSSVGSEIDPGLNDTYSHCNGNDGENDAWRVYDHRTEGEVHINKRDMDLENGENDQYSSYGDTQGDSTLEGAVYGLFVAENIVHPDGKTGIVYRQNNLVSVAATDKNGDASFLINTEAPGHTYHYSEGTITETTDGWAANAPPNLYVKTAHEDDYTKDGPGPFLNGERATIRSYTNNEASNGNCWIGRPLLLGKYYVKELTRSEGYELSVNGRNDKNSNHGYDVEAGIPQGKGSVSITRDPFVEPQSSGKDDDTMANVIKFNVSSYDTWEKGYDIVLQGYPAGTKLYRKNYSTEKKQVEVSTGVKEKKYLTDILGNPIYQVADADHTYPKRNPDGTFLTEPISVNAIVNSMPQAKINQVDADTVKIILETGADPDTGIPDIIRNEDPFSPQNSANNDFFYIKMKLEESLRANGYRTPFGEYTDENGIRKHGYSGRYAGVFDRGVREGEADAYGVSGVTPGDPAAETVYGSPVLKLDLPKIKNDGTPLSVGDAILSMLDFYSEHGFYNYGGIEALEETDTSYIMSLYAGIYGNPRNFLVSAGDNGTESVIYHAASYVPDDTTDCPRWVYVTYSNHSEEGAFGTYENLKSWTIHGNVRYSAALVTDAVIDGTGAIKSKTVDQNVYFAKGETILDQNGKPEQAFEWVDVMTTVEQEVEVSQWTELPLTDIGDVQISHVSSAYTDGYGVSHSDNGNLLAHEWKLVLPVMDVTLTEEDIETLPDGYGYSAGEKMGSGDYVLNVSRGVTSVYLDYANQDLTGDGLYIKTLELSYPGQTDVFQDGAAVPGNGTRKYPIGVQERIIKQKIKVTKSIQTNADGTYGNHTNRIHEDWFTKTFGGLFGTGNTAKKMDNFRFKIYLKSNLERLYRDETGGIIWQDRKGNETDILLSNKQFPALVPKIHTKASHKTTPLYQDSNDAIIANDSLYGYTDGLIHEEPNSGYTSVLEMTDQLVADGAVTRTIRIYNYDKFFDALAVANQDKWDDAAPAYTSWQPIGNEENRTEDTIDNARASDMVRQFAIDWYLKDEIAKLVRPVTATPAEKEHVSGDTAYTDAVYDQALSNAINKADNYLKPFFAYDLDEIYAIGWDSADAGGEDADITTLTADTLYGDNAADSDGYYFAISRYLPYGTYVIAEQQPRYADMEDFKNRHYQIDKPKEVMLPSVYADYAGSQASPEVMNGYYHYSTALTQAQLEQKYHIRFNKEVPHIIHGRNTDGDFEVYKYGMDIDAIKNGAESAGPGEYFALTQDEWRPYKNYYNIQGDRTAGDVPYYLSEGLSGRIPVSKYYRYSSVSEHPGIADAVPFPETPVTEDHPTDTRYQDDVATMKGVQTAYDGKYAAMLVPWTVTAPSNPVTEIADSQTAANGESSYKGFAYSKFRNRFYAGKLRIEKLDSETHENILHDSAIFNIYAAKRDDSPGGTGQVKFYEKDTTISGSQEFLTAMGASNITPFSRNALTGSFAGAGELYSGLVPAGTPICKEAEQIIMTDEKGNKTGEFRSFTTTRDGRMKDKDTNSRLVNADQNTGYLETPQPLGAGVYVLCEIKPPSGYTRTKPIPIEVYSDAITYYKEGNRDTRVAAAIYKYPSDHPAAGGGKPQDFTPVARVNVENAPIKLTIEKVKESSLTSADTTNDKTVTYKVSGRIDGSLTRIGSNPSYEYAYENGDYLGYAWQKGTLEYLNARKAAGETVDIVYQGRTFAGYGYVTRKLETSDDINPYVTGAVMTLFEAIELTPSGDREDYAYEGLEIERSATGNISRMYIKQGHAGSSIEFVREVQESGDSDVSTCWTAKTVERDDTDILYYDLDHLDIFAEEDAAGGKLLYGFNKNHIKVPVHQLESDKAIYKKTDTELSIFAFKGGVPYLEFVGGDFTKIVYSQKDKSFTVDPETVIYHIDRDGNRDAEVDPHTGMAYVRQQFEGVEKIFVWPIKIARDEYGNIIARDKITTSRIATVGENRSNDIDHAIIEPANNSGKDIPTEEWPSYTHTESGYISGTWESDGGEESHRESTLVRNKSGENRNNEVLVNDNNGSFAKSLGPVYNTYGLADYYQRSEETYENGTDLYDRNNDPVRYRDSDKLEHNHEASYTIEPDESLHNITTKLYHRKGENYILENTWVTSDQTPNDPFHNQMTDGQPDILKRIPSGTYIMEELKAPDGYLKTMPKGVLVEETDAVQSVRTVDKTTKIELSKVDSTDSYECKILDMEQRNHQNNPMVIGTAREAKGRYSHHPLAGAALALYEADKIYTSDINAHPKGWYLKKKSPDAAPFSFHATSSTITSPQMISAQWTTGSVPIYLEGIPEGYYILEEQTAPPGFVKSQPLELYVANTAEVQLFSLPNDHTKLEVEKYTWENGKKTLQNGAGLTLYEAKTDDAGNVIYENGRPQYHQSKVIDTWISNDAADFTETLEIPENAPAGQPTGLTGFITEFETMYRQYGTAPGTSIRWSVKRQAVKTSASEGIWYMEDGRRMIEEEGHLLFPDGVGMVEKQKIEESWKLNKHGQILTWLMDKSAHYVSHTQIDSTVTTRNKAGESSRFPTSAVMIYETDDKQEVRITIYQEEAVRQGRDFTFEYQFDYRRLSGVNERACSYLTTEGIRRFDYLPVGANYVLVETEAPAGYEKAEDRLILIQSTRDIQRYSVENKTEELLLSKTWLNNGKTQKELSGVTLALYRAAPDGTFIKDAAYLVDRWKTGEDGTYGELEFINGHIPDGYQKGDLKPHGIRGLEEGIYYLTELKSLPYYTRFTPMRFEYKRTKNSPANQTTNKPQTIQLIRAINQPVTGQLEIMKQSATGLPLTGVLLEINACRPGDREAVWSATVSDHDGVVRLDNLPVGEPDETGRIIPYTYRVTELVPPEGCKVNTEIITFQFQPDNNGDSYAPTAKAHISLTIRDEQTQLYIEKKDFDTNTQSANPFIDGALLAIYEVHGRDSSGNWLYDSENDKREVWRTTKAEERHLVKGLVAGRTYLLKELEAPSGYQIAAPLLFTVSQDGRNIVNITNQLNLIQIQGDSIRGRTLTVKGRYATRVEMTISDVHGRELERWLSDGRGHTLTASDMFREDRLYLLNEHTVYSDGSDLITSRVLRRFYFDENKTCCINDRTVSQVTMSLLSQDDAPILSFTPKEYVTEETTDWNPAQPDTVYRLKETTIYSDGQTNVSSQWSFSVNDQSEINAMTLYDRKLAPLIQKIDATTGRPLSQAALQLEDTRGTVFETWMTDQSPCEIKTPLSPETTYRIRETQAPPGYQQWKDEEMITFRITDLPETEMDTNTPLTILADNRPEPTQPPKEPASPDKPQPTEPSTPIKPPSPPAPTPPIYPPVEDLIPPFPFPDAPPPKTGLILAFYEPSSRYPGGLIFRRPGQTPGRGYPRPRTGDDTPWLLYLTAFTTSILGILFLTLCRKKRDN